MNSQPEILKKSSRSGRYRKLLITPEELLPFAPKLTAVFKILDNKKNQGEISDAEFLSYGLLALLACRRQDAFQKNPAEKNKTISALNKKDSFSLTDFFALLKENDLPILAFKKFIDKNISLLDFLNQNRFRGIPDSARQALLEWLNNKYPLKLLFTIPTVSDVFELQKQGGRCVSFLKDAHQMTQLHHDRDVISFVVHDLIHAHEFYSNPQRARQQIGFYHWLDNIQNNPQLKNLINTSTGFQERWEYLLSDMNSYCGHLLKTLHAAFVLHTKESATIWQNIIEESNLSDEEQLLFLRINTHDWVDADFLQLEKIFENKMKHKELSYMIAEN